MRGKVRGDGKAEVFTHFPLPLTRKEQTVKHYHEVDEKLLRELAEAQGLCVSLIIPTQPTGRERMEGRILLKNASTEAESELSAAGMRPTLARDFLKPVTDLLSDDAYWMQQSDGLAVYMSEDTRCSVQIPAHPEAITQIAPQFYIRPLTPFALQLEYYVLALDRNRTRALHVKGSHVNEVKVPGMPESIMDVIAGEHGEKQRQMHVAGRAGRAGSMISHVSGDTGVDEKNRALRYCQAVDQAICKAFAGSPKWLVLAADDPIEHIYLQASHYPMLARQPLEGSPKIFTDAELAERAKGCLDKEFAYPEEMALVRYASLAGTGYTSANPEELMGAAERGEVDVLFLSRTAHRWIKGGIHKVDMLNSLSAACLINGGKIYELDPARMPSGSEAAGIFRYVSATPHGSSMGIV